MLKFVLLNSLFSLFISISAESEIINNCHITPAIWSEFTPPPFNTSNNLRRKAGSDKFAQGQFINIIGQVLDSNCIPVSDANVKIWHANAMGVYENDTDIFEDKDPDFTGSGYTVTDNLGRFSFFTIMPAASGKRAPHVKFSISHYMLNPLETEMFFPEQYLTKKDPVLNRQIAAADRNFLIAKTVKYDNIENADVYEFNITLEGELKYKQY